MNNVPEGESPQAFMSHRYNTNCNRVSFSSSKMLSNINPWVVKMNASIRQQKPHTTGYPAAKMVKIYGCLSIDLRFQIHGFCAMDFIASFRSVNRKCSGDVRIIMKMFSTKILLPAVPGRRHLTLRWLTASGLISVCMHERRASSDVQLFHVSGSVCETFVRPCPQQALQVRHRTSIDAAAPCTKTGACVERARVRACVLYWNSKKLPF